MARAGRRKYIDCNGAGRPPAHPCCPGSRQHLHPKQLQIGLTSPHSLCLVRGLCCVYAVVAASVPIRAADLIPGLLRGCSVEPEPWRKSALHSLCLVQGLCCMRQNGIVPAYAQCQKANPAYTPTSTPSASVVANHANPAARERRRPLTSVQRLRLPRKSELVGDFVPCWCP